MSARDNAIAAAAAAYGPARYGHTWHMVKAIAAYEAALSAAGLVVVPLQALEDATEFLDMWAGDNSDRANEPVWNALRTLRAMIAAASPAAALEDRT